jgi:hypothetical protein
MTVVLATVATAPIAAGATTPASATSIAKDLLPSSYAKNAGFPRVARKVSTSSKTGLKSCPNGARETFESASRKTALASEVVACTTKAAAAELVKSSGTGTPTPSVHPPARLGASAFEQLSNVSIYQIVWQKGAIVEAVALNVNVPASSGGSSTTNPITPAQQKVLSNAALKQNGETR